MDPFDEFLHGATGRGLSKRRREHISMNPILRTKRLGPSTGDSIIANLHSQLKKLSEGVTAANNIINEKNAHIHKLEEKLKAKDKQLKEAEEKFLVKTAEGDQIILRLDTKLAKVRQELREIKAQLTER